MQRYRCLQIFLGLGLVRLLPIALPLPAGQG